jgi:hypothetical protein
MSDIPKQARRKPVVNQQLADAIEDDIAHYSFNSPSLCPDDGDAPQAYDIAAGLGQFVGWDMAFNKYGGTEAMCKRMGRVFADAALRTCTKFRADWEAERAYKASPEGIAEAKAKADAAREARERADAKYAAEDAARAAARAAYLATPEGIHEIERHAALADIVATLPVREYADDAPHDADDDNESEKASIEEEREIEARALYGVQA